MAFSKFLNPRNDVAFKRVFGAEKNKEILLHFLNDVLDLGGVPIKDLSYLKTVMDPETLSKKESVLDVLCVDEEGKQYIIEMQVGKGKGFEKRAQFYAARAYGNQLDVGEEYYKLKEVIFLAITDFVMFPDKLAYKSDHVILDKKSYEQDLKSFSFTFIELPKFTKPLNELSTILEKWTYFFKHAEETTEDELVQLIGNDTILEKAYKELNKAYWSDIEMNTYEASLKRDRDAKAVMAAVMDEGIEKGKQEGIKEGRQDGVEFVAKNLIKKGQSLTEISELTGLSLEELKKLL